jgi:UDP-glucose 4-epimerase
MSSGHILVTGGAGFIGSHLVERLLREGKSVVVLDDFSTGSRQNLQAVSSHNRLRVIESKISACKELAELVEKAEAIYHLAAAVGVDLVVSSPVRVLQSNLHESELLLELASARGIPLLFTSTSEVYGKSQKDAFSEDDDLLIGPPQFARWSYACSKLMDEFLIQAYIREQAWPAIITRLFNTVGPRQTGRYGMVLPRFILAAKANQPMRVYGDGSQTRCFSLVHDTVEALVRLMAAEAARGQTFNIGTQEEVTILRLAEMVIEILNSKSTIELVPYNQAYAPGFEDMLRRKPVVAKLAQIAGFKPGTPLRKIIEVTAASNS